MNMFWFNSLFFVIALVISDLTVTLNAVPKVESESQYSLKYINLGDVCGQTLENNQVLLKSPKYPEKYPRNFDCQFNLKGRNCPAYYKFNFIDFDIHSSPGCVEDRLEIGLLDALCGVKNGTKTYLAKNGTLSVKFKTSPGNSSGRFEILVTRLEDCANEPEDTPKTFTTGVRKFVNPNLKECCLGNSHTSRHLILKSPNFPLSMSYPTDCIIQINKASADICRIRILFKFFWFGNSLDCSEGFLQIDGKMICGCRADLKLMSEFNENVKILRFKSAGLVRNSYSGFIAEIFQDECPKKVREIRDHSMNRTQLVLPHINREQLFKPLDQRISEEYIYNNRESLPDDRREPNDFLATENINEILRNNVNDFGNCLQWNQEQFNEIFSGSEIKMDQCRSSETRSNKERECTIFKDHRGFFFSPGYPFFYPGNSRICYKFDKFPGSCAVRIYFFDFRIGPSESCSQDRFEIGERAYCGVDLWNRIVNLDLRIRDSAIVNFITSTPKCLQGFKAYYEYLPCEEIITESPVPPPITKIFPVTPPITENPKRKCGRVVREEIFSLSNEEGNSQCFFMVEKSTEEVCQLIMKFERFSLDCSSEILKINGKPFCGNQAGNEVNINAEDFPVEVIYNNYGISNKNTFKIEGIQDTTSCQIPEPPAQLS